MGKDHTVIELKPENIVDKKIDFAIFSAGASVSKIYAPIFAEHGAIVVDNSSQWRMDPEVPLVVPEVNGDAALNNKGIIANPNCSTIQAVVALKPLYDKYGIKRIVYTPIRRFRGPAYRITTTSGTASTARCPKKFPYPIFGNVIPHIDVLFSGYTQRKRKR